MSVFIDTGVFVAFRNKRDEKHEAAKGILKRIVTAEFGTPYTSDYVFDETVTLTLARTGDSEEAVSVGRLILGEVVAPFVIVLRVEESIFRQAWGLFQKHASRGLSFTDCSSLSLIEENNIERIASFDSGFDGLITRIH